LPNPDKKPSPENPSKTAYFLSRLLSAVALHFAYYNFCRVHSSLRVTPAMEAGVADHVWTVDELLAQA